MMQPATHRMATRRLLLDAALVLVPAGASLLWNDALRTDSPKEAVFGPTGPGALGLFESSDAWRAYVALWWLVSLPAAVAILVRHRWPVVAFLLAGGSAAGHLLDPFMALPPMDVAVLVTMYTLAGSAPSRRTILTLLVAAEALLFTGCVGGQIGLIFDPRSGEASGTTYDRLAKAADALMHGDQLPILLNAMRTAAVPALLLAATWAVADSARTRRAHLTTLQARADDLEREQGQRTALAVAAERGRITRELHDVVAHGLSVMVVQAQGAKAMLTRQPERTHDALTNIVTTGRASLAEMRRLLGLVRAEPSAELAPQPSLAALPELIDRVRDSGVPVEFRVTGEPATLPAVIELTTYRIVQEALTNTLKHATPGAACAVALDYGSTGLGIRVADSGGPVPPPTPGNGLRGITERVHALGGEVRVGPVFGGGFELTAWLAIDPGNTTPERVAIAERAP
jgi:signal transduction histidine kinase